MMATTTIEDRARERLAQQERARLEQAIQELHAEDERKQREREEATAREAHRQKVEAFTQESQARIAETLARLDAALDAFVEAAYAADIGSGALGLTVAGGYRPVLPRETITAAMERALTRRYPRGTR